MRAVVTAFLMLVATLVQGQSGTCAGSNNGSRVDFLFLLDYSQFMEPHVANLARGLNNFLSNVAAAGVSARYGVVRFGSYPTIYMTFTTDGNALIATFNRILSEPSVNLNQEASFEAIRASLPPDNGAYMSKQCVGVTPGQCVLEWRPDALKSMILITDENSDMPTMTRYRLPGHENRNNSDCTNWLSSAAGDCSLSAWLYEPSYSPKVALGYQAYLATRNDPRYYYYWFRSGLPIRLNDVYQAELNLTASMLLQNGVFLSLVTIHGGWGGYHYSYWWWKQLNPVAAASPQPWKAAPWDSNFLISRQYGHISLNVQNATDLSRFNINATLANHFTQNLSLSLQARVLSGGGIMRIFNLGLMNNQSLPAHQNYLRNMIRQIVSNSAAISRFCTLAEVPMDAASFVIVDSVSIDTVTLAPVIDEDLPSNSGSSAPASDVPTSDNNIKNVVDDIKDKIEEVYREVIKDERNVAGFFAGVSFAVIGGVALIIVSYRNRQRAFDLFRGKVMAADAQVYDNPLDKSREPIDNPLYETKDKLGALGAMTSTTILPSSAV